MLKITKYNDSLFEEWEKFISESNNGTIFQKQAFLQYHINRKFVDGSLIIKNKSTIVAVVPAAINDNILYSHPGSSYGGIVLSYNIDFKMLHEILKVIDEYCIAQRYKALFLINSPSIYQKKSDQSLDYLLQWNGFKQTELYISHAVDMSKTSDILSLLAKRKRRYINNNQKLNSLTFEEKGYLKEFYDILVTSKKKYNTTPTHSLDELIKLKDMFPKQIKLLVTRNDNKIIGGSLIFFTNDNVALVFYNTIIEKYRESQIAMLQLYKCMEIAKKYNLRWIDFGVSHTPEQENPLAPKFSLIHFKEQFNAKGVLRIAYQKEYGDY
tara:strand:- start:1219 stop:2193 length:975 start_codon:yes stop_codon:yes gene_type:complete